MSLPEITDEDRAVAEEARRIYREQAGSPYTFDLIGLTAALVRTGWKPVDPDLILAREVAADTAVLYRWHSGISDAIRRGIDDTDRGVQSALAAIKAADARRQRNG